MQVVQHLFSNANLESTALPHSNISYKTKMPTVNNSCEVSGKTTDQFVDLFRLMKNLPSGCAVDGGDRTVVREWCA